MGSKNTRSSSTPLLRRPRASTLSEGLAAAHRSQTTMLASTPSRSASLRLPDLTSNAATALSGSAAASGLFGSAARAAAAANRIAAAATAAKVSSSAAKSSIKAASSNAASRRELDWATQGFGAMLVGQASASPSVPSAVSNSLKTSGAASTSSPTPIGKVPRLAASPMQPKVERTSPLKQQSPPPEEPKMPIVQEPDPEEEIEDLTQVPEQKDWRKGLSEPIRFWERNVGLIRLIYHETRKLHIRRPSFCARAAGKQSSTKGVLSEVCADVLAATKKCVSAIRAIRVMWKGAERYAELRAALAVRLPSIRTKVLAVGSFLLILQTKRVEVAWQEMRWRRIQDSLDVSSGTPTTRSHSRSHSRPGSVQQLRRHMSQPVLSAKSHDRGLQDPIQKLQSDPQPLDLEQRWASPRHASPRSDSLSSHDKPAILLGRGEHSSGRPKFLPRLKIPLRVDLMSSR